MALIWNKWVVREAVADGEAARDHFSELSSGDNTLSESVEAFFSKYLGDFNGGRVGEAYRLIRPRLRERDNILSVASGHFAIEMALERELGASILCTDQQEPPWLGAAQKLFPSLRFRSLDVTLQKPAERYSAILCIGLTYLLDDPAMRKFLQFSHDSLEGGGRLYIGINAPDTLATRIFHRVFLPLEARTIALFKGFRSGRAFHAERQFHGYHHNIRNFVALAAAEGFEVESLDRGGYEVDFHRSPVCHRLLKVPVARAIIRAMGRAMPFESLFVLRKRTG